MSVTKERFEQGLTYEGYKAQMTRNQERFDANEATVEFDRDDLAFFARLAQPVDVLVLAEDWCGDVIANLPVLGRLAQESGKLNLRVFLRDQNLDLMDQYLKQGEFRSIPTFVFFDAAFNELGHWTERPERINELQAQMRKQLFARDPLLTSFAPDTPLGQLPEEARDRMRQAFADFREENHALTNREVQLRVLLEACGNARWQRPGIAQTASVAATTLSANGAVKVSITYCADCGYEPQTLDLTSALMKAFVHNLASIELIPWQDGAFDVVVNGDLVHSMYRDGGFPEHETILRAVRERLG